MRDRRVFLSGLAGRPLVGGAVTLLGQPTAVALPITTGLLNSYKSWLHMEHRMLSFELAGHDRQRAEMMERSFLCGTPGADWHLQWSGFGGRGPAGWIDAPQPSTRAALVLSAAGCDLGGE